MRFCCGSGWQTPTPVPPPLVSDCASPDLTDVTPGLTGGQCSESDREGWPVGWEQSPLQNSWGSPAFPHLLRVSACPSPGV